jgi:hypothetical protein
LLRIALISLIISSRNDPSNFHALYYNMNIPATTLVAQALSVSSDDIQLNHIPLMNKQNISSNCHDNKADYEKVLLTESEMLYNKIIDIAINKTINGGVNWRNTVPQQGETELFREQKGTSQDFSTAYQIEEQIFIQSESKEDTSL